jgi:hypothetical protein
VKGVFERRLVPAAGGSTTTLTESGTERKLAVRSDALALYQKRKADARRKVKLPELVRGKTVTFGQLSEMAVKHAETHLASPDRYKTKDSILREPFGARPASAITPQEIDEWLSKHCKTDATANRYRAFFSLAYRLGMENGKVPSNPARLVRLRTGHNARMRFLSRAEYAELPGIIQRDNPQQAPAFILSVYTGMRWGEQFSLEWGQVDLKRKIIRLTKTKNGSARNVPSNAVALERTQPALPLGVGHIRTATHDYIRHGTVTLFAALNYLEGKVVSMLADKHRHQEWIKFLKRIDQETPKGVVLHLIADNYATHKHPDVQKWLAKHKRFHMHFTPTSASWMNLVERFFRDLTKDVVREGSFRHVKELCNEIMACLVERNAHPTRYTWNAKGEEILRKIQRAKQAIHV